MNLIGSALLVANLCTMAETGQIELLRATLVVRPRGASEAEKAAVTVLVEEAEKRTGVRWTPRTDWPAAGAVIVAASKLGDQAGSADAPESVRKNVGRLKREGFILVADASRPDRPGAAIMGAAKTIILINSIVIRKS